MSWFKVVVGIGAGAIGGPVGTALAAGILAHTIHDVEKSAAERNTRIDAAADQGLKNGLELIESEFASAKQTLYANYEQYLSLLSANQKDLEQVMFDYEQDIIRAGICIKDLPRLFKIMLGLAMENPGNNQYIKTSRYDLFELLKKHRRQISFLFNWSILQTALLCQDHNSSSLIISEMLGGIDFEILDDNGNSLLQLVILSDNKDLVKLAMYSEHFRNKILRIEILKQKYAGAPLKGYDKNGKTELTKLMLRRNVDSGSIIDLISVGASIFEKDAHNNSVIEIMVMRGLYQLTLQFLARGFNRIDFLYSEIDKYINIHYPSRTEPKIKLLIERVDAFKKLSRLGFNGDIACKSWLTGYTALTMAVLTGEHDFVKTLLDEGFDPNETTADGILPIEFAYKFKNHDIVNLLKRYKSKEPNLSSAIFFQSFIDADVKIVKDEYIKKIFAKAITMGLPIDTLNDMWFLSAAADYHRSLPIAKKFGDGEVTIIRPRNEPSEILVKLNEASQAYTFQSHVVVKNIFPQNLDIGMESLGLYGQKQIARFKNAKPLLQSVKPSFDIGAKINSRQVSFYGYDLPFLDSEFHAFNISRGHATELMILEISKNFAFNPLIVSLVVHKVGQTLNTPSNTRYRSVDQEYIMELLDKKIIKEELFDLVVRQFATPCNPGNRLSYYKPNPTLGTLAGGTAVALAIAMKKNLRIWRHGENGLELDFEYKNEQGFIPLIYETIDILNKSLSPDILEDCSLLSLNNNPITLVPSHVDLVNASYGSEVGIIYKSWLRYIGNKSIIELCDDAALRLLVAQYEAEGKDYPPEDMSKNYYNIKCQAKRMFINNVNQQPHLLEMAYYRLKEMSRDVQLKPYVNDIQSNLDNSRVIVKELFVRLDQQLRDTKTKVLDEIKLIDNEKVKAGFDYIAAGDTLSQGRENNIALLYAEISKFKDEQHRITSKTRHTSHAGAIADFAVSQILPSVCENFKIKDIYQAGIGAAASSAAHGGSLRDVLRNTTSSMMGSYLSDNFKLAKVKSKNINNIVSGMVIGFAESTITGKNRKDILRHTAVGGINAVVKANMSQKEISLIKYAIYSSIERGLNGLRYSNNTAAILENMIIGAITPYIVLAASAVFPKPTPSIANATEKNTESNLQDKSTQPEDAHATSDKKAVKNKPSKSTVSKKSKQDHVFDNVKNKQSYEKAKKECILLEAEYEEASTKYDAEIAQLDKQKGLFARAAAMAVKNDLEETVGLRVFNMANKLDRLRDEMQSYITQDKDEQVDRKIDKLAVKEVVEKKFARYVFNQPNFVKDYYENVGLLFGYGVRHASTKLKAVASRHKQEIRIAQLAGVMAMPAQFIAAPVATSVGIAMYSMLSYEPVESKIIEGLVRTLDVLGVDQYNREALAKFATESFKIGTSAVAPKAGAAVVRQAVSSGKSAFERGIKFVGWAAQRDSISSLFKIKKLAQNTDLSLLHQYNRNIDLTIRSPSAVAIQRGWGDLSVRQAKLLEQLSETGATITIKKNDINVYDIACLTAQTGDEFAIFTLGGRRMVLRGDRNSIEIISKLSEKLKSEKWKWSAHTHVKPGDLQPSGIGNSRKLSDFTPFGDRDVLATLDQEQSLLLDSLGKRKVFNQSPGEFIDPLPKLRGKQ